jgi:methyl-accepting chemotaxis protein
MKEKLEAINSSVCRSHETLHDIATIDMSSNILIKQKIDEIMRNILTQNDVLSENLSISSEIAAKNANDINGIIVNLQFQDKLSQHLNNNAETLAVLIRYLIDNLHGKDCTIKLDINEGVLQEVLSKLKLGELKQNLMDLLIQSNNIDKVDVVVTSLAQGVASNDDDVELF